MVKRVGQIVEETNKFAVTNVGLWYMLASLSLALSEAPLGLGVLRRGSRSDREGTKRGRRTSMDMDMIGIHEHKEATRGSWHRLGARTLLGAPGLTTSSKDATRGSWPYY